MTIFERISSGELPAYKILEDSQHLAILDRYPTRPAQVVVFTKQVQPSQFTKVTTGTLNAAIGFAQQVAAKMEQKLIGVKRVIVAIEGLEINHFHIKLYPVYEDGPDSHGLTGAGNEASDADLQSWQQKING